MAATMHNCEIKLLNFCKKLQSHKNLTVANTNGLLICKNETNYDIYYVLDAKNRNLTVLNLQKLPQFEKSFVLNFAIQNNDPKQNHFIHFLNRNTVKKSIERIDAGQIKNFWMIPNNFNQKDANVKSAR
jgi:hypothetical protein